MGPNVDKMITLFDFEGSGLGNLALNMFKTLNPELSRVFPHMTYKNVIVHPNWILSMGWKVAKNILSTHQKSKVLFVEDKDLPEGLEEFMDIDNIPKEYGGNYVG